MADPSGKAARLSLEACNNRRAVRSIRYAATSGGIRDLSRSRARMIVALGLTMVALATARGDDPDYGFLLRGIPQAAFRSLLRNPFTGAWPSLNALIGIRGADASIENSGLGYIRALEQAGLFRVEQPSVADVPRNERLGSHALARYHVVGHRYEPAPETPEITDGNWSMTMIPVREVGSGIAVIADVLAAIQKPPDI